MEGGAGLRDIAGEANPALCEGKRGVYKSAHLVIALPIACLPCKQGLN